MALPGSIPTEHWTAASFPRTTFNVTAVAVQSDDKVIIGGGGHSGYVYRLNADGSMETAFTNYSTGPNGPVYAVALQPDGKIIIGGSFTSFNGTDSHSPGWTPMVGWTPPSSSGRRGLPARVRCIQVQPDGKILIGGEFSSVNGATRYRVARLTSNGALDPGFVNANVSGPVYAMQLQSDSRVLIGGNFNVLLLRLPGT